MVVLIVAYLGYVLLQPVQHLPLILQPGVEITVLAHALGREEAQDANTVIEVDEDDVSPRLADDFCSVEESADDRVATALYEQPHRELGTCCRI